MIATAGGKYGMELHWSKFQLMQTNCQMHLRTPGGEEIEARDFMAYLGATIYADGGVKSELNRRLGAAWREFSKLKRLWYHSSLTLARTLDVFGTVVASRLLYSFSGAWLNVAELRRLNGFHCRCLRSVLRIPPAIISRV